MMQVSFILLQNPMSDPPTYSHLQESQTASSTPSGCRFRPYASAKHHVTKGRYITSNDPRGYMSVSSIFISNRVLTVF